MHANNDEYVQAFNRCLAHTWFFSVGYNEQCETCCDHLDPNDDRATEFSRAVCDACGSHLAGPRYAAHGIVGRELQHLEVCQDCLMYWANGELPYGEES